MSYQPQYRDRELRLPLSMVRANEYEKQKIEGLLAIVHGELASHLREIAIAASDFFLSDEIRWFMAERNLRGVDGLVLLREALANYRRDIHSARQVMAAADAEYARVTDANRMPSQVAMR